MKHEKTTSIKNLSKLNLVNNFAHLQLPSWANYMKTLPETNSKFALENRPLEKEVPIGHHKFYGRTVSFRE